MEYANLFLIKKGSQVSSMDLLLDMISIKTKISIEQWACVVIFKKVCLMM